MENRSGHGGLSFKIKSQKGAKNFFFAPFVLSNRKSRLAAVANKVVHLQHVEPGGNVFAVRRASFVEAVQKLTAIAVVRRAVFLPVRPCENFRHGAFMFGVHKAGAPDREDISTWFEVLEMDDFVSYGGKA